jgi:hypothetical protein
VYSSLSHHFEAITYKKSEVFGRSGSSLTLPMTITIDPISFNFYNACVWLALCVAVQAVWAVQAVFDFTYWTLPNLVDFLKFGEERLGVNLH